MRKLSFRKLMGAAFAGVLGASLIAPAFAEAQTTAAQRRAAAARAEQRAAAERDYEYRRCMKKRKTTGTVLGAVAGGVLGSAVAGNSSNTAGTILGAGAGAVAGNQIAKKRASTRC